MPARSHLMRNLAFTLIATLSSILALDACAAGRPRTQLGGAETRAGAEPEPPRRAETGEPSDAADPVAPDAAVAMGTDPADPGVIGEPMAMGAEEASRGDATQPAGGEGGSGLRALDAGERATLEAIPHERISAPGEFYYRSNEWRHDLLASRLEGLGGALVGVGSDQCYTLAAMAGSELILAIDYDSRIAIVHRIYSVLVPLSETPAALIARYAPEAEAETLRSLAEGLEGDPLAPRALRMFQRLREDWHAYLGRVQRQTFAGRPGTWLASEAYYAHIRLLFEQGRVVARTGDVTAETTLRAAGRAAAQLGIPMRLLYFSNAEQFFRYTPAFRENLEALPSDARTLIVRTLRDANLANAEGDRWHYIVQDFTDFQERLSTGAYPRLWAILRDLLEAGAPHVGMELSTITNSTPRARL
ncbi:MAG: hypothetical protein OEY14_07615, partial [Myxococcales bacterium]|nr:hypothetical protein [Myxococcales bacterium]